MILYWQFDKMMEKKFFDGDDEKARWKTMLYCKKAFVQMCETMLYFIFYLLPKGKLSLFFKMIFIKQ